MKISGFENRLFVKSGALYLTIGISIVISILSALLFLLFSYNKKNDISFLEYQNAIDRIYSSHQFLKYQKNNFNQSIRLFDGDQDSVRLMKKRWGLYYIHDAFTRTKKDTLHEIHLMGFRNPDLFHLSLYTLEHNEKISLCGKVNWDSKVFLSKYGITQVYLNGQSFNGSISKLKNIHHSMIDLPSIKEDIEFQCNEWLNLPMNKFNNNQNPFSFSTQVISFEDFKQKEDKCYGNYILKSNKVIVVEKKNKFENILLVAPIVKIKSGFTGNIHILATDTIIIEDNVQLNYPSSMILYSKNKQALVRIGENSKIEASCLIFKDKSNTIGIPILEMNKGCVFTGEIYNVGNSWLQGKIIGPVYTNKLFIKSNNSMYENILMNVEFCNDELPEYYAGACILDTPNGSIQYLKKLN